MIVGIDSKKLVRPCKDRSEFISILGVGICVEDYPKFKKNYEEIIKRLFQKRNLQNNVPIYKSSSLKSLGLDFDFFKEFYNEIKEHIDKIYIFLTMIKTKKIKIFPKSSISEISPIEFMTNHLEPSYPHACAWAITQEWGNKNRNEMLPKFEGEILLDDFGGNKTNAWNQISPNNLIKILPNGDKTDPLISTSDIMINYLDLKLLEDNKKIGANQIIECLNDFPKNVESRFIGDKCLWNLIPLHKGDIIKTSSKMKHPIIFVLRGDGKGKINKKIVESSPIFSKVIKYCYENEGCCKFLDLSTDIDSITFEDYILPVGEEARAIINQLKELGYKFMDFKE